MVTYYDSYEPMSPGISPVLSVVEPIIRFSWPGGYILPTVNTSISCYTTTRTTTVSISVTGETANPPVRWSGYVVAPRSNIYQFVSSTINMTVTIIIESTVVFDTITGIYNELPLIGDAVYAIVVEARIGSTAGNEDYQHECNDNH